MQPLKDIAKIYHLVWRGSLFNEKSSLISEYRIDEQGFNGRLVNRGKQLAEVWPDNFTISVQGDQPVDYFLCGGFYDVVSDPVCRVIQDVSNDEVEFLPIRVVQHSTHREIGKYWILNVIKSLNGLNEKQSTWSMRGTLIKPAIRIDLVKNSNIFHLEIRGKIVSGIYLTDRLKVALETDKCILGMEFASVKTTKDEPN
jgi:hypothetical protein